MPQQIPLIDNAFARLAALNPARPGDSANLTAIAVTRGAPTLAPTIIAFHGRRDSAVGVLSIRDALVELSLPYVATTPTTPIGIDVRALLADPATRAKLLQEIENAKAAEARRRRTVTRKSPTANT